MNFDRQEAKTPALTRLSFLASRETPHERSQSFITLSSSLAAATPVVTGGRMFSRT
jgi:hypothetical protein